ncbi:Re/Si-specific NAD(P)(+) transhydrogenase subunit alpha [Daejeonella lutea]|uniref:proton-translocating NAD(P)(+) transhydrogenase n=1 Tax=Daejeonella lutea TaxID=572036 RepID=A0A1T5ALZ0_9SPHI|nr:Re/Si-specific NAD(P)(+) transhydrogenase subunit alpha [Daejeonella lutea]SKB35860.1 NAD(P) transhydrogenase subunit alpha [Daejeonella lutea]
MTIGILCEPSPETRVSLLPEHISTLKKQKIDVLIESNAGSKAFASDLLYQQEGAEVKTRENVLKSSDIILTIHHLSDDDLKVVKNSAVVLGMYNPLSQGSIIDSWAKSGLTTFSMDMLPRTTRAQSMDVLSSQANIAGYKAVLLAAMQLPKYFPMFMTAAGSIAPAKVMILGAGVAGLQAIATAKRLGAVVEVFDTRPAVKEEVMSLGAKFIEVEGAKDASGAGGYAVEQSEEYKQKQQQRIAEVAAKADVIITTAQIPGKKAPILLPDSVLDTMKTGSLIIDLASVTGGNTEQTKDRETVTYKNVTIIGNSNLQGTMPADASKLYGKNILNFLQLIIKKDGELNLNFEDDLVKGACITHGGEICNERVMGIINN